MAVLEGGVSAALADVGAATKAMRVEPRPADVGVLGAYQVSYISGTMAAGLGAAAPIFSCRWGNATNTMLLRRVSMWAKNAGTAFAAGNVLVEMMIARSFTASDSAGTAISLTGNETKKRTSFGSSLITDLRGSATAALTAGTRTLDTRPISQVRAYVPATQTNYAFIGDGIHLIPGANTAVVCVKPIMLFWNDLEQVWPVVFVQNEGFILRATVPATGTWEFGVDLEWAEVANTAGYN